MSGTENPLSGQGRLSYLEIPALDARKSATFYEQVVGRRIDQRASDDFRFSGTDGLLIGRWITGRVAAREPGLLPFIYVDPL
jgi:predicted enzyme related to lactoylglutathione lyase